MKNSVSVGIATVVGYGTSLLLAAIAGIEALQASGPTPAATKWLSILAAVQASLTTLGRQYQAAQLPPAEATPVVPPDAEATGV